MMFRMSLRFWDLGGSFQNHLTLLWLTTAWDDVHRHVLPRRWSWEDQAEKPGAGGDRCPFLSYSSVRRYSAPKVYRNVTMDLE